MVAARWICVVLASFSTFFSLALPSPAGTAADDAPAVTHANAVASVGANVDNQPVGIAEGPEQVRERVRQAMLACPRRGKTPTERAVRQLVATYESLLADTTLRPWERKRLLTHVAARLADVAERLSRRPPSPPNVDVPDPLATHPPVVALPASDQTTILAQRAPRLPRAVAPAQSAAAGAGGSPADNGQELVELIQRTICPPAWNVNGGPGSIHYFRRLRVLVVSAPGHVHEEMRGLLGGLRR